MRAHIKTVLRDTGTLLHAPGAMALASVPVCLLAGEPYAVWPFLWAALASFCSGQLLYRLCRQAGVARLRHAMLAVALSWGAIPLLGAIPFFGIASHLAAFPHTPQTALEFQNPWNALFESYSGFTGTGLSVALHPSQLPRSLQWWRSFSEWVGGVGMIVLVLSVLEPSTDPYQLYSAEGRQKRIALTVTETVRKIWKIYLLYTVLSVLLLRGVGMPWWEALNHGLTGISTGGFSVRDDSIGAYGPLIQLAVIPIMAAGAVSFSTHYHLLRQRRLSALWQDGQHRALWLLFGLGTVALCLENRWLTGSSLWLESLFQWVSALGTCGFNTVKIQFWSPGAKLLLSLAMVFGAASGSTVGGLKLIRVRALYKAVLWRFQRLSLKPHQLMRYELDGKVFGESEANRQVESAAVLAALWLSLLAAGVLALLHIVGPQYTLTDIIFEAASALGNVGLSVGITHADLQGAGKLILILFMWMGRLEIIPVLVLFSSLLRPLRRAIHRQRRS